MSTKNDEEKKELTEKTKHTEKTRILTDKVSSEEDLSCVAKFRQSPDTATFLCFLVLFLDAMLLTSLEPILPEIVRGLDDIPEFLQDEDYHKMLNDTDKEVINFGGSTSSLAVGIVFSAKPLMELCVNFFVGLAVDRYGYTYPMHFGYLLSISSAVGLGLAKSYWTLLVARCLQGIGNPFLVISSLAFLSYVHGNSPERSAAFALTFIGGGLGSLVGFPYGGLVYEYVGREYPYLILGILIFLSYMLRLTYKPHVKHDLQPQVTTSGYLKMCRDFYIVSAVVSWINLNFGISSVLVALPLLADDELDSGPLELGVIFLVSGFVQAVIQGLLARHTHKIGWWKICFIGGLLLPSVPLLYTVMPSIWWFLIPNCIGGIAMGLFLSSFHAMLCHITDIRVGPNYGAAFSFNKIGYGIGTFSGSILTSVLIDSCGYDTTFYIGAAVLFTLNLTILFLRDVPSLREVEMTDKAKE